jgi:hypothetical protein
MPTVSIVQRIAPHMELIYAQEAEGTVPPSVHLDEPWAHRIANRFLRVGKAEPVWQPCLHKAMHADLVVVEQANRLLVKYALITARGRARLVGGHRPIAWEMTGANFAIVGKADRDLMSDRLELDSRLELGG